MNKTILSLSLCVILFTTSCKDEKASKDIIVPVPAKEVKKGPQQMTQTRQRRSVEWLGSVYGITIVRTVDKSLPLVSDESNQSYYDNSISVRVQRQDGSDAFNRTFTKSAFAQYISGSGFEKSGALLGIVFDKVENNRLVFATSIGSPDITSDEFIPLILSIDRNGNISIEKDTQMDSPDSGESSHGITGDEEA